MTAIALRQAPGCAGPTLQLWFCWPNEARERKCAPEPGKSEHYSELIPSPRLVLRHLRPQARLPLPDFRRGRIAEVLHLEQWSDLDLAFALMRIGAALDPVQRLL